MRVPVSQTTSSILSSLAPLAGVVFLLAVVLFVASDFAESDVPAEPEVPAEAATVPMIVQIMPDGRLLVAGQPMTSDELAKRIETASRQSSGPGPVLEIELRCQREVPYRHVEPVLLACAKHGVWNVHFAVIRSEGR